MSHEQIYISLLLCLLIWFVQLVHYPFFQFVNEEKFSMAMNFHQQKISYLTLPLMLVELALCRYDFYSGIRYSIIVLLLVVLIWLHTFMIMVPIHKKLLLSKDKMIIAKLINNNWARTILWTIKLIIVLNYSNL